MSDPPHYYLSVGLSDVNLKIDPTTAVEESDPKLTSDCVKAIVKSIKETCRDFDNKLTSGRDRIYIAPHERLDLAQSRLGNIVDEAVSPPDTD